MTESKDLTSVWDEGSGFGSFMGKKGPQSGHNTGREVNSLSVDVGSGDPGSTISH